LDICGTEAAIGNLWHLRSDRAICGTNASVGYPRHRRTEHNGAARTADSRPKRGARR